jgi:hypothetical protein
VKSATDAASKAGVTGTPTMLIDGKEVDIVGEDEQGAIDLVQSTIDAAAAGTSEGSTPTTGGASSG